MATPNTNTIPIQWTQQGVDYFHIETFPHNTTGFTYFALTDALLAHVQYSKRPTVYFWPTEPFVFLGMIDSKLPFFSDATQLLTNRGYPYIIRNSGGLAVVSDPGVLNMSVIFPEEATYLDINTAYQRVHQLIQTVLQPYNIHVTAEEIPNSYCPGHYDLSINGRKIAGISQRRVNGGVAVMIYISVTGNQLQRCQLIQSFYQTGLNGQSVKWAFPTIDPQMMTTIQDELDTPVDVTCITQHILKVLFKNYSKQIPHPCPWSDSILADYQSAYNKMIYRNHKLLGTPSS